MIQNNETISIGWIDNGNTEGDFTFGLVKTIMQASLSQRPFNSAFRISGSHISKQRQLLINEWMESDFTTDWILLIDSDVELKKEHLDKLIACADKDTAPVVTGLYFILRYNEDSEYKVNPEPCIYSGDFEKNGFVSAIHSFAIDSLIPIDYAGLGFALIHKGVIEKIYKKYPNIFLFKENDKEGTSMIGEDFSFFQLIKNVGIQSYCHTGINPKHIKKIAIDLNYVFNGNFGKIEEKE